MPDEDSTPGGDHAPDARDALLARLTASLAEHEEHRAALETEFFTLSAQLDDLVRGAYRDIADDLWFHLEGLALDRDLDAAERQRWHDLIALAIDALAAAAGE